MAKYAGVIVDISLEKLDRVFEYRIPEDLEERIFPGVIVWIPFGNGNRKLKGFVCSVNDTCEYDASRVKELLGICEGAVCVESRLIALAEWMRTTYGCTMNQALKTVIPVKKKVREQVKQTVLLAVSEDEARSYMKSRKRRKARIRVLELLLSKKFSDREELLKEADTSAAVLRELEQEGMIRISGETVYRIPTIAQGERNEVTLNAAQKRVLDEFLEDRRAGVIRDYLIHGVTGSGKTEVYMSMIDEVLKNGKQAIVLIPEIALTFQTVMRFCARFGSRVSVIHSKLSAGERYDQFERAKNGQVSVMIGPRSAVFTPFPDLGMIIMDEEHESSYKSETTPKYHAREVAKKRCEMAGASLVLGSATPSVESYYLAKKGVYRLCSLEERIGGASLAEVHIADLREELKAGNRSVLSRSLHQMMEERLRNKEQIILFLNRRGMTGFISCRSCGYVVKCPHCDVSLTLHKDHILRCHYCGYEQMNIKNCPQCASPYIGGFRAGTQSIEAVVRKEFPQAKILRMDLDTTRKKGSYEQILDSFARQEADILIGTQMIVKGHDFPNVTLVGVLLADLSLHSSDYMASERTFQLLTQAVGRAGRDGKHADAVIQTYQPEHYSIRMAAAQDYRTFYETEIAYRELMSYPPMSGMMVLLLLSEDEILLEKEAEKIKELIMEQEIELLRVTGPAPAAVSRISDIYRRVIYLKHEKKEILYQIRNKIEKSIAEGLINSQIRLEFDENPLHMY
ncbi:MAG: primosomal protein N' [Lachnospiraceae bacterium]